jgi:deoxycytidine triphosphate deaminase
VLLRIDTNSLPTGEREILTASRIRPRPGEVLTGESLRAVLYDGTAFDPTSIDEDCIGIASYDLRLARDMLIVPGSFDSEPMQVVEPGEHYDHRTLTLNPGQTAYVASEEHAQFDWTMSGTLGPKFSLTIEGLIILTGLLVDPGYGLCWSEGTGTWIPDRSPPRRLHFVLANAGSAPIALLPGKTAIVRIQLFRCEEPSEDFKQKAHYGDGWNEFGARWRHSGAGLDYFATLTPIVANLEKETKDALATVRTEIDILRTEVKNTDKIVQSTADGSQYVVVFGVYLLSATVFGVALNVVLSSLSDFPRHGPRPLYFVAFLSVVVFLVAQAFAAYYGLSHLKNVRSEALRRSSNSPGP